ncbi:MAG TPA: hypothetical protein VGY97_03975 [Solirubrobacteraceae bacterium]|nr:hypothetical protein [Solirubrobacteraceae bacterium]
MTLDPSLPGGAKRARRRAPARWVALGLVFALGVAVSTALASADGPGTSKPLTVANPGITISATEGSQFSGTVATHDMCTLVEHGTTIDWGDGQSSEGSDPGGTGNIGGTHTYAEEGGYDGLVTYKENAPCTSGTKTAPFHANVADAALSASGVSFSPTAGSSFSGQVATLTDADPQGAPSDYTVSIDWGDGSSSAGSVTSGSPFTVNGSHTYGSAGTYQVSVTITDHNASASAQTTATVGLPSRPGGLEFTTTPNHLPLIAGAPVTFAVVNPVPGLVYEWSFDSLPGSPFTGDPSASGGQVKHSFPATSVHDANKVAGPTGQRRQTYRVRLRATGSNGSAEVEHDVTVLPPTPPRVDFVYTPATGNVNDPMTFVALATSPDAEAGAPNRIVAEIWDLGGGHGSNADLVCLPVTGCLEAGGTSTPKWLNNIGTGAVPLEPGAAGQAAAATRASAPVAAASQAPVNPPQATPTSGFQSFSVNFFERGLVRDNHIDYLTPTFLTNVSFNIGTLMLGVPGSLRVFPVLRQGDAAALYQRAFDLEASSFDQPLGEATGATVGLGVLTRSTRAGPAQGATGAGAATAIAAAPLASGRSGARGSRHKGSRRPRSRRSVRPTHGPPHVAPILQRVVYRPVTLTAVDALGEKSSITKEVPLLPDAPPQIRATFVNQGAAPPNAPGECGGSGNTTVLCYPITTDTKIAFDATGTVDPDGPNRVKQYVLEAGTPMDPNTSCHPAGGGQNPPPPHALPMAAASSSPGQRPAAGALVYRRSQVIGAPSAPAAGLGGGSSGQGTRARAAQVPTQTAKKQLIEFLAGALGTAIPCQDFAVRNVTNLLDLGLEPGSRGTSFVTSDASKLAFTFPQVSPPDYSVSIAAYDDAGLGSIERVDGFHVVKPGGTCNDLQGEPVPGYPTLLGFSGACFNFVRTANSTNCPGFPAGNRFVYFTQKPIDINGVMIAPDAGGGILIDGSSSPTKVLATTQAPNPCDQASVAAAEGAVGAAHIVIGSDQIATYAHFDPTTADRFLGVGSSARLCRRVLCRFDPPINAHATYKGFTVAQGPGGTGFHVNFQPGGLSTVSFRLDQPPGFCADPNPANCDPNKPPTQDIVIHGQDVPQASVLTTNPYPTVARNRPKAIIAGNGDLQPISLPATSIGPVRIDAATLSYDSTTEHWTADVGAHFPMGISTADARVRVVLGDGRLIEADGKVAAQIPIFAGVVMDEITIGIKTDPVVIDGGVHVSTVPDAVEGQGNLHIEPGVPDVRLSGTVSVEHIQIGSAYVEYRDGTLTFGGHIGKSFGPASIDVDVRGGLRLPEFYVEGDGKGCLFVCLELKALVSNIALAACGQVSLGVTTIGAGIALRFDTGLETFAGCDLTRYIPIALQSRAGPRAGGQSVTVNVPAGLPSVAIKAVGDPAAPEPPRITVTGPNGDNRVITTPPAPGDYAFSQGPVQLSMGAGGQTPQGTSLIDQNPVDHTTTVIVANPVAGAWTVSANPGQPPLTDVRLAQGLPPVTASTVTANVAPAHVLGRRTVRIGNRRFTLSRLAHGARSARLPIAAIPAPKFPIIEQSRLRGAIVHLSPAALRDGTVTLIDDGPNTTKILGTFNAAQAPRSGVPAVFVPSTDTSGKHQLVAFVTQPDGTPRASVVLSTFTPPGPVTPPRPRISYIALHRSTASLFVNTGRLSLRTPTAELLVKLIAHDGQVLDELVPTQDLHSIGHDRYRITIRGLDPHPGTVHATVSAIYQGLIGSPATRTG